MNITSKCTDAEVLYVCGAARSAIWGETGRTLSRSDTLKMLEQLRNIREILEDHGRYDMAAEVEDVIDQIDE